MSIRTQFSALRDATLLALVACAAIGVPLFFTYSTTIALFMGKAMDLQVEPSISGGRMMAEFADPIGDDTGAGSLEYPIGREWARGELDIVRYAVRESVKRPVWGGNGAYWQLEATFAKAAPCGLAGGGFRAPVLHVYIGIDGAGPGSTESAYGEGELLRFDPDRPWHYAVSADGWSPSAGIRSADGKYEAPVEQSWSVDRRRLTLRIGLEGAPASLASVLGGRASWHYVLVGAYDGAREGHYAGLREFAGIHEGGGAQDELCPRVFDLVAPRGKSQARELSSQDSAKGVLALIFPVEVGGAAAKGTARGTASGVAGGAREALEAAAKKDEADARLARARDLAALPPPSKADADRIGELFGLGLEERALAAANEALARKPGNAVALAYRGAIVARSAERASGLGTKMRLVAQAYADLDSAAEAAKAGGPSAAGERIAVLLCRGSVSAAVPNDVFGRAAQGAADFEEAGALAAASGDAALSRRCLADACLAFEVAGLPDEAGTRWATLAAMDDLSPAIRLELLDRGISP